MLLHIKGVKVSKQKIQSVLFCCDYNSVRSPMAEGIFKKLVGRNIFVQSAGIYNSLEIDGFAVRVCSEIDITLTQHTVRSLLELDRQGGFVGGFDLIVSLTELASKEVNRLTKYYSVDTEFWSVDEPQKNDEDILRTLESYRTTRDIIQKKLIDRFQNYLA